MATALQWIYSKISLDKDINACFVSDSETSERDPLEALLQVAIWSEELMETDMLPNLPPQPEPTQVSNAAQSDSELSTYDFEIPANNLTLKQIPFPMMALHISGYLSSVNVNPNRPCWSWQSMSRTIKLISDWKPGATQYKNNSMHYLHSITYKITKIRTSKCLQSNT